MQVTDMSCQDEEMRMACATHRGSWSTVAGCSAADVSLRAQDENKDSDGHTWSIVEPTAYSIQLQSIQPTLLISLLGRESQQIQLSIAEGPGRPVLECIDLDDDDDDEDEGCPSFASTIEDKSPAIKLVLAQTVALEKQEILDKCRAFKEKQILQRAHGRQELAFTSSNGFNRDAKTVWTCGPKPGVIHSGFGGETDVLLFLEIVPIDRLVQWSTVAEFMTLCPFLTPALNILRLKKHGKHISCPRCPHLPLTVTASLRPFRGLCFACPACFHLFHLRDECLQHMTTRNHFTESLAMSEPKGSTTDCLPQYAKNRLIALCKDVPFKVRCSLCHKVLISHQAAKAHFNVRCRDGCAVSLADQTILQVMKRLQVAGQCSLCSKIFLSQAEMEKHKESTQHDVEVNNTMAKALLQYCRFREIQHTQNAGEAQGRRQPTGLESPSQKRTKKRNDCDELPAKRKRGSAVRNYVTAWICECNIQFSEEATAKKHIFASNQIFHQCGVCGKHMGESAITHLHMSRFHGGSSLQLPV
ncbi:hypothetical protein F7725_024142 [Dissostichus mawsoni]|uniref:C2H2-type domain-containing protein n=1 Tax=Dissostichus mawsoni TaxID=36200 RepID=A0A7J5XZ78_DISMA|nr:hypothetical protein F7725_024142 [Dissostichus mawsoni]